MFGTNSWPAAREASSSCRPGRKIGFPGASLPSVISFSMPPACSAHGPSIRMTLKYPGWAKHLIWLPQTISRPAPLLHSSIWPARSDAAKWRRQDSHLQRRQVNGDGILCHMIQTQCVWLISGCAFGTRRVSHSLRVLVVKIPFLIILSILSKRSFIRRGQSWNCCHAGQACEHVTQKCGGIDKRVLLGNKLLP